MAFHSTSPPSAPSCPPYDGEKSADYDVQPGARLDSAQDGSEKRARSLAAESDGAVRGEAFVVGDGVRAKLMRFARRFGVEARGIERVPEDERTEHGLRGLLNVATMWLSTNMVISSFSLGLLAKSLFGLGVADACLVILFFNLIGLMPVCIFSTFGPAFGLRQMVLSRFWFGWWGVRLTAIFNVCACIGWSSVNTIAAAELIHTVNPSVPGWAGVLIVAFCTLSVVLFGYKIVHYYEFWSWLPATTVFLVILGVFAHSGAYVDIQWGAGTSEMGGILSFGASIFGFAAGWSSIAADYTVYQPSTQSKARVFGFTFMGLIIPLLFTQFLGVACMSATAINGGDNRYQAGYDEAGTGGLLGAILIPPTGDFGRFCMVILALTTIANNCPNIYSVSLTVQVFGKWIEAVPRFLWTLVGTAAYIGISIPGYSYFETVLENFMNFIGYWIAIYSTIGLLEHFVFRRGFKGYKPELYDQPDQLPVGLAAVFAFCCGVVGMVAGMSQTWWVGWVALHAGSKPFGGDVGWEFASALAATAYLITRSIELRFIRR